MLPAPVCLEAGAPLVWTFDQCLFLNKVCFM